MKLDLHVHTKYSKDSKMEPSTVVSRALKLGLDGVAVIDHGTVKGGLAVRKIAPKSLTVIVGSEVKTDRGEVIGYFIEEEIPHGVFQEVVEEIRAHGGVAVVPHPYDPFRPNSLSPREEDAGVLDGLEVFNSRCLLDRTNKRAIKFARTHGLIMTAGSDAHTPGEIGASGVVVEAVEDIRKNGSIEIFGRRTPMAELFKARVRGFL
ncbi:MAG: PHP-associated domain-containing protein [Candidatus Hydrothermarchaeota archaeon]|jgi:hypothetical protein|nr:PHP-associated domain-containing protein [Candidatus Hydrothermarchaeota archaeon]